MTVSVWRLAHLALALVSFIFLSLASITGVILAIDAADESTAPYRSPNTPDLTLAQSLPVLKKIYPEITEISVDHNGFVTLEGYDEESNDVNAYVDPNTGTVLGTPKKKSEFIQWVTSFHRSLFLHEAGRLFVGINTFILALIAVSGTALILQRQRGLKRFFSKIVKDYLAQYYHVVAGRLLLIPTLIIALTGTYLSMERFHLFDEDKKTHLMPGYDKRKLKVTKIPADFEIFKQITYDQLEKIEFPFNEDREEHYTVKLKERELIVEQFTGEVLSQISVSNTNLLARLSLDLHTGRGNPVWAIILAIASFNILFFIVSGFSILLKRRATRLKNKYKASESEFILLVGSENGSTLGFANAIHTQLLANGERSYIAQLDNYTVFPKAKHLLIFTSTHGLGDAPSNATKFLNLMVKQPQQQKVQVSVVGFGSESYPDFCGYAADIDLLLREQNWAEPLLDLYTVNDKSAEQFTLWVKAWSEKTHLPLATTLALYKQIPGDLQEMMVLEKTKVTESDQTFLITLRPRGRKRFTSGDLLAVYPGHEGKERFYSIGKLDGNIQLLVKLHAQGLGSNYLNGFTPGSLIKARILRNDTFHFPKDTTQVAMIANGTGIAPFLGMIQQNRKKTGIYLYCGFRKQTKLTLNYKEFAAQRIKQKQLSAFNMVFSREEQSCYVMDLIARDAQFFTDLLKKGGVIMICGSRAMQVDVEEVLNGLCIKHNGKGMRHYKRQGQILIDSY